MNKKNVFLWTLYDFANSIVMIVFFLYFSQWLVIEKGVSDLLYNSIFAAGSLLFLVTAPILGNMADQNGKQVKYLNLITILSFVSFLGVSLVTLFFTQKVFLAVLFFFFANYFYQFSFIFYNALLSHIAPKDKWGVVSGIGQTGNWIGQIAGLLVVIPFASGAVYLFGEAGRAQTFLPASVIFFILALPMLLLFKLPPSNIPAVKFKFKKEYLNYWTGFKEIIKVPNLKFFLLSFFFFNDAVLTAASNFPIYLQKVFNASDKVKSLILLGILVTSAIGALCAGFIADRIGLKKTLTYILGSWVFIFLGIGAVSDFKLFVVMAVLLGFMYGATWTVTRAIMATLLPKEKLNFGFSFYTLSERLATFIGPLSWGLIVALLSGLGPIAYRLSISFMAVFVVVGVFFFQKVELPKNI